MSTQPATIPRPLSLVDQAMAKVREYIRANDLKVGAPLPGEAYFAGELGVSRAVMREAFGALAALRQIDVANGRRARVGAIDGSVMALSIDHAVATSQISVADVWDVRRTLELRTIALAAAHRSEQDAAEIVRAAEGMGKAANLAELTACDIALHELIARASGNSLFHQIIRSFGQLMEVAVPQAWQTRQTSAQREQMLELHCQLAHAIARQDPDTAVGLMDHHFDNSIGDLIRAAVHEARA